MTAGAYEWDAAEVARLHRRFSSALSQEVDLLVGLAEASPLTTTA